MDARKLVGMTQGARRRRLWDAFFDEAWDGATINNFRTEAAKYRLGQRLRPCPGCKDCGTGKSGRTWRLRLGDQLWISGSLKVKDPAHICDGSGVIPAKARKVRR